MTKKEAALVRKEIREIKSALTAEQRRSAMTIKALRKEIRHRDRDISSMEANLSRFAKASSKRIAILQARLES